MRTRTILNAVLLAAALCCGAGSALADIRSEIGADQARLIEGVAAKLYPGATVDWTPSLTLVQGTSRQPLRLGDIEVRKDDDGGFTGVVALELTAERAAITAAIEAFESAPARSAAEIVAFKATSALAVTTIRRASLGDPSAAIEEVDDVELTSLTYANPWPDAYVTYTGVYGAPDFHGQIEWEEKVTFDPEIAPSGRAPVALTRRDKEAIVERSDRAVSDVVDENTISFASAASGHVISNCADPCLPDGRVLLGLWWTAAR